MKTPEQEAAELRFKKGESFAMRAGAGCGKTTTLVSCFQFAPPDSLSITFNKANALELQERMPATVQCKTLNALGHKAWMGHIGKGARLDTKKLWTIWNNYPKRQALAKEAAIVVSMVKFARVYGISPGFGGLEGPDFGKWEEVCDNHDLLSEDLAHLWEAAAWLLKQSCIESFQGLIDFDDQIYMPVLFGSRFQRFPCLSIDEAQDLNGLQHTMVERSLAKDGQILVVGDPNQAIYGFRGASHSSFSDLTINHNLDILPLLTSFRCPKSVIREAQIYVPDINSAPTAPEGTCEETSEMPVPQTNLLCLSRTNAPLISLAFDSIRKRVPVDYLGRDFMGGLQALHKKHPTPQAIKDWAAHQVAASKSDAAKARTLDRAASILFLHEESEKDGVPVAASIAKLMEKPVGGAFTLSTIHKIKGKEAKRVFYLDYFKRWKGPQENNIKYVGVTRAQQELTLHRAPERGA